MGTQVRSLLAAFFLSSVGLAADPDTVIQQIRSTRLDPSRAAEVKGMRLVVGGGGVLTIRSGVIVPASPIGSAPIEMVFIGDGTIEISAPDDIEADQLELFTGSTRLAEDFEEGVFVVANDVAVDALLKRRHPDLAADKLSRAVDLYQKWVAGPERKQLSIESLLFADGVGDAFHRGFFSASVLGRELGRFLYLYHPDWEEEITLGQFVPLPMEKRVERKIRKRLEREQRRGRLIGVRLEDLGQWDTWISASIRNEQGEEVSSVAGFEPQRYVVEIDVADRSLRLGGKARIDLTVKSGLRKLLKLQLHSDLTVHRVAVGGAAAPFFRSGTDLYVFLSSPPEVNETVSITVEYSGDLLEKVTRKTTALRDTSGWYPRLGTFDRARYDVTFRWPRDLGLVSAGKRVDGGTAGGRQWERRTLDTPSMDFSFEVGRFVKDTFQAGHVAVTLAYDAEGRKLDTKVRDEIHKTIHDSLLYFEETYGRYPLDELIVVTVPRDFSQSHLGFITLSNLMMADFDVFAALFGIEDRRTVIAHEIAHQWWGHLVGWLSYRDQWFTEALANYSALQFSRKKFEGSDRSRPGPTSGWQAEILDTTEDGRTIESLGPLILGERLMSSRSDSAYEALIYKKGPIVIDMLARNYGQDNFDRILKLIVKTAENRQITTKDLLRIVHYASDKVDVDGFAKQFIFGTGVPVIRYDYEFLPKGSSIWTVKGVATQYRSVRFRYRIVSIGSRYDVIREEIPQSKVSEWAMVVPFQVGVTEPVDILMQGRSQRASDGFIFGRLSISTKTTPFEFEVKHQPRTFWLDRDKETLARFFSPQTSPKLMLVAEAGSLAADGRFQDAEEKYREALRAPKTTEYDPEIQQQFGSTIHQAVRESQDARLDALAHLGIARIRLDQKQHASVPSVLHEARKAAGSRYGSVIGEIGILEGRLHIEQGDYESGFKRLRKLLLGRSPASSDAEGFAWLAIAAKLTQHPNELQKALEAADRKGVDTTALK